YDGHGSVRQLIDASGVVSDTYTYEAFGATVARTGETANDYLYAGEQIDVALGMYYLRARYMNPAAGRFWTLDGFEGSLQDPVSLHKYLYASANAPNASDPSGNMTLVGALNAIFAAALLTSLIAYGASIIVRSAGATHLADQIEGFGRIAGGIAFVA